VSQRQELQDHHHFEKTRLQEESQDFVGAMPHQGFAQAMSNGSKTQSVSQDSGASHLPQGG